MADKALIEKLAFHMADELGQLGHHEDRWYNVRQRRKFETHAKNIVTLMRNGGFLLGSAPVGDERDREQ